MKQVIFIVAIMLFGVACEAQTLTYSNPRLWYRNANKAGEKDFDVFYLLPTCVWDRIDSVGDTVYYADPLLSSDRLAMLPSFELAERIFGEDANFYSPYYRQLALQSWRSDSLVSSRFHYSFADVKRAFDYYMDNVNQGRPFVLAGFSQGAKCVVELLKNLTADQCRQLVAAYVIGYKVTASDTLNHKQIKPAVGENDFGVTICYNSVANTDAICSVLAPSAICINPVNWTTSAEAAMLNDSVSVCVDKQYNVLIVDGADANNSYVKSLDFLFKKGNYHLQELNYYHEILSKNIKVRFCSFKLRQNNDRR